jgi:hypothetical protein
MPLAKQPVSGSADRDRSGSRVGHCTADRHWHCLCLEAPFQFESTTERECSGTSASAPWSPVDKSLSAVGWVDDVSTTPMAWANSR